MTGYQIICADSLLQLDSMVNTAMREGWQPIGGVAMTPGHQMVQALVRPPQGGPGLPDVGGGVKTRKGAA